MRGTQLCVSSGHVGGHPQDQFSSGSFARGAGPSVGGDDSDTNEFTDDAGSSTPSRDIGIGKNQRQFETV